jgi:hypothetical protein
VENNDTLIGGMAGLVLLDRPHDATDELDEGTQVGEDAPHHRNREVGVIEALSEHTGLNDDIQLVVFELLEHTVVRLAFA